MGKISRELKTGIVAIVTIIIFIWGFNFLKRSDLINKSNDFYAEYNNVQGLIVSAPVTINGLRVGSIKDIYFHPSKRGTLVVRFSLEEDYDFSKKSIAQIYSPDFISGKSIKILPSYDGETAKSGDTLAGRIEAGILGAINDQIAPLQKKVEGFLLRTDSLVSNINDVFDTETKGNLRGSIAKLNSTLASFNAASQSLNKLLATNGKIDSILTNATTASGNLAAVSDSLANANIKSTIQQLESTLAGFNGILTTIDKGEGSLGKLLKDEGLYDNLEGATKEMEELLREMKLNPKRFVHFSLFGKKPKPYSPQEAEEETTSNK